MFRLALQQTKSLSKSHPWIFSGAVAPTLLQPGQIVWLEDERHQVVATAYACPNAKIRLRVLDEGAITIDKSWWKEKVARALERRRALNSLTNGYRLIYAESDGLPGLIVDFYNGYLCLQAQTQGLEPHLENIVQALVDVCQPKAIFERSDSPYRAQEGLKPKVGLLWGETIPDRLWIHEYELEFAVSLAGGQKSGHYCDQRENRQMVAQLCKGARVLDLCCNSGGFALQAIKAGASQVVAVDSSALALEMVKLNHAHNSLPNRLELLQGDIASVMTTLAEKGELFDCIILDPPKLAPQRHHLEKAQRAYKDLNRRALKLLAPGGRLFTFSCSAAMSLEHFQRVIAWSSLDADKKLVRLHAFTQPIDHPIALHFPESEYLKGLSLQHLA